MPDLIERWRRRDLLMAGLPTRYFFRLVEEYQLPELGFQVLANRHQYGLRPRTWEFNRVLRAMAAAAPHLHGDTSLEASEAWGEKMVMIYGMMPYYRCVPDQATADAFIPSLANSPVASLWGIRLTRLAREFFDLDIKISADCLKTIMAQRVKFGSVRAKEKAKAAAQ